MPIGSLTLATTINAVATKPSGGSTTQGTTTITLTQSFSNGTSANQATGIVDACITSNAANVALGSLSDTLNNLATGYTRIKGLVLINSSANSTAFVTNTPGAPNNVTIDPGGLMAYTIPANGLTVSSTTTFRSDGNAADSLRVVLFLS